MANVALPTRMSSGLVALRIASSSASVIFVVIALVDLISRNHPHLAVTVTLSLASAAACAVISRVSDRLADGPRVEALLALLCVIPLVDVLVSIAVLGDIEITSMLNLTLLVFGLLTLRWRVLGTLLMAAVGLWLAEAVALGFAPHEIRGYLGQLLLRAALAVVVFKVRDRLDQQLRQTGRVLDEQVEALAHARALNAHEQSRFRSVFEHGPVGIIVSDLAGVVLDANQAVADMMHLPRHEVIGSLAESYVAPEDRLDEAALRRTRTIMEGSGPIISERRIRRPDGTELIGRLTAAAISGPEGEPWVLSYLEDITRRREMERDLVRSRDSMRAVADIASAAQRGVDPRPVAIEHLRGLAHASLVCLLEPKGEDTLVFTASEPDTMLGTELPLSETSTTGAVFLGGEPVFIADAVGHPAVHQGLLNQAVVKSAMWQPVGQTGAMRGVLVIAWDETSVEVTEVERDAVRSIAAELSSALDAEGLRQQLERRSVVDALTGLLNRRGWDRDVAAIESRSRRENQPVVIAVADLDHFKRFNDEFGHFEGDLLLSGFAAAARDALRDRDVLARWGGEEFAIALPDCDLTDGKRVLERIRQCVPANRTCSIGFATLHPDESIGDCMRRADEALYRAKSRGRDRIEFSHEADVPAERP